MHYIFFFSILIHAPMVSLSVPQLYIALKKINKSFAHNNAYLRYLTGVLWWVIN